jgi:hypothetical protein
MPKAMDVEDLLIWAFRDQKIDLVAAAMRPKGPSGSSHSSLAEMLMLGTKVDTTSAGARHFAVHCHEDAAVVYDAVMALPPEAWMFVIKHAKSATQPDWHPEGPGRYVVPLDKHGQPKRLWRDPAKQRGDLGPMPAELVGTNPVHVEESRRAYAVWHAALVDLVALLNTELVDHEAIGPAAMPEPWAC